MPGTGRGVAADGIGQRESGGVRGQVGESDTRELLRPYRITDKLSGQQPCVERMADLRELIDEREWLTVFLLPAYSPGLPVEGVWAHVKHSLANPAVIALDRLETLVRDRLKSLQYRPDTLDGFIAGTRLPLDEPASP